MNLISCPNCSQLIEILELNCCIFRCGVYKINHKQINPHTNKETCLNLVKDNKIYGCGAAFKIIKLDNELKIEICDYI
jgi:hypothetical protein